jgi:signal transduction histidine kinase
MAPVSTHSSTERAVAAERVISPETLLRRLAASMSHHVNNALTGVIGYLGLALREAAGKGNLTSHLQGGLDCAYQAADTVRRLVAFAVPTGSPALSPIALRALAEEAAEEVRTRHSRLHVAVTGAQGRVFGSTPMIRYALEQLVRNAVEAMPREGELVLHIEETSDERRIKVIDRGPGFTEAATEHLFDPFWTSKPNGHLGIGLILSRDIASAHGGSLALTTSSTGTTAALSFLAPGPDAIEPATLLSPSSGAIVPAVE